jgi:SUMO ligase MMS21 Smc5/6 complex component
MSLETELKVYHEICKDRFDKLENELDDVKSVVGAIREKIFNGHTHAIMEIQADIKSMRESAEVRKRSKALFARDVILTLLGSGGIVSLILMQIFR